MCPTDMLATFHETRDEKRERERERDSCPQCPANEYDWPTSSGQTTNYLRLHVDYLAAPIQVGQPINVSDI